MMKPFSENQITVPATVHKSNLQECWAKRGMSNSLDFRIGSVTYGPGSLVYVDFRGAIRNGDADENGKPTQNYHGFHGFDAQSVASKSFDFNTLPGIKKVSTDGNSDPAIDSVAADPDDAGGDHSDQQVDV